MDSQWPLMLSSSFSWSLDFIFWLIFIEVLIPLISFVEGLSIEVFLICLSKFEMHVPPLLFRWNVIANGWVSNLGCCPWYTVLLSRQMSTILNWCQSYWLTVSQSMANFWTVLKISHFILVLHFDIVWLCASKGGWNMMASVILVVW